jgi:hypothetical protein
VQAVKKLTPIRADILTEEFFVTNKWTDWDKRAWKDMCHATPSVLLSDNPKYASFVSIDPVLVPVWMQPQVR